MAVLTLLGAAHVSKNSGVCEWYTPSEIIEAARATMRGIDLDPASCAAANEVVKAERFFTKEDNGLEQEWSGRIWLNPPYSQPIIGQFIDKLIESKCKQSITLVRNATKTEWGQKLLRHATAVCFPDGRIKFWSPDKASAPLQGHMIVYRGLNWPQFFYVFRGIGPILTYVG